MSFLKIWEAPEEAVGRDDFEVSVRIPGESWQPLFVYEAKVDMHNVRQASMVFFDMEGTLEVRVECRKGSVHQTVIRPLSKQIPFEVEGAAVTFRLNEPCKLSIEVNGDRFGNLHLFANAPEENPPEPDNPNVLFLKPAIHRMEDIQRLANSPLPRERNVDGVTFTNLRINGELVLDAEQGHFDINEHAHGIQFHK